MTSVATQPIPQRAAQPTWEIARLFPYQGEWTPAEYLALDTNQLVELADGRLEFLPRPKLSHQLIVAYLLKALWAFCEPRKLGLALQAGVRVRLWEGRFREPDLVFMLHANLARCGEDCWQGADLVMEVVSPDDPQRDWETKRVEYAQAGIPEYWIVDAQAGRIAVFRLEGATYALHGEFSAGQRAGSALLPGFEIDVVEALKAGRTPNP